VLNVSILLFSDYSILWIKLGNRGFEPNIVKILSYKSDELSKSVTNDKTCYHYWKHVLLFYMMKYSPKPIES
ncbi:MAG: hypothetical protein WA114_04025, partial [Psychrobacter glacincola]